MNVVSQTRKDVALFLVFCLTALWCANSVLNPNSVTRVGLSHSLVAHGRLDIDEVAPYTIDKARWQGHYYCDKTPGISLLCLPGVYVAGKVADLIGAPAAFLPVNNVGAGLRYGLAALACLISTSILFGAAAVVRFRRAVALAGANERTSFAAALALAFGTPLFIWSTAVFGHATATALLFIAFSLQWTGGARRLTRIQYAIAGVLLSLAVLVELTALPAAAMIAALLLFDRRPVRAREVALNASAMFAGAVPAGAVLLLYNAAAFGSPFHLGYSSVDGFNGMKSGFFGISLPTARALWGITFSPVRGIFWLSPVLLFSIPAIVSLLRRSNLKPAIATCLGITAYYLLLNGGYYYWDGGYSLGPRHITPIVPFLMFPIALWADCSRPWMRIAVLAVGLVSILIVILATSVSFLVEDDGKSMLGGHVLPKLMHHHSDALVANLHVPFLVVVAVPLALVAAVAIFVLQPALRARRDLRTAPIRA